MGTNTIVGAALLAQAIVGVLVWILAKRGSQKVIDELTAENARLNQLWIESVDLNIDQAGVMGQAVLKMYQSGTNDGRAMGSEPNGTDAQNDAVWSKNYPHEPRRWDYGDNTHPIAVASDLARFRQSLHRLDGLPDFDYQSIPKGVV